MPEVFLNFSLPSTFSNPCMPALRGSLSPTYYSSPSNNLLFVTSSRSVWRQVMLSCPDSASVLAWSCTRVLSEWDFLSIPTTTPPWHPILLCFYAWSWAGKSFLTTPTPTPSPVLSGFLYNYARSWAQGDLLPSCKAKSFNFDLFPRISRSFPGSCGRMGGFLLLPQSTNQRNESLLKCQLLSSYLLLAQTPHPRS